MSPPDAEDTAMYKVVVNHEEQYPSGSPTVPIQPAGTMPAKSD